MSEKKRQRQKGRMTLATTNWRKNEKTREVSAYLM